MFGINIISCFESCSYIWQLTKCNRNAAVGMAILPRPAPLDPPLPASPRAGFPGPAKVMGRGWVKILDPHHGAERGRIYTF